MSPQEDALWYALQILRGLRKGSSLRVRIVLRLQQQAINSLLWALPGHSGQCSHKVEMRMQKWFNVARRSHSLDVGASRLHGLLIIAFIHYSRSQSVVHVAIKFSEYCSILRKQHVFGVFIRHRKIYLDLPCLHMSRSNFFSSDYVLSTKGVECMSRFAT